MSVPLSGADGGLGQLRFPASAVPTIAHAYEPPPHVRGVGSGSASVPGRNAGGGASVVRDVAKL